MVGSGRQLSQEAYDGELTLSTSQSSGVFCVGVLLFFYNNLLLLLQSYVFFLKNTKTNQPTNLPRSEKDLGNKYPEEDGQGGAFVEIKEMKGFEDCILFYFQLHQNHHLK